MKHKLLSIIATLLVSVCAVHAQTTHWQYNPHDYEYDMTAYVSIEQNGAKIADLSNYEIAAFRGNECRGVAEIIAVGSSQVGYLRIRSNVASGETITFKAYIKDTQEEKRLYSDPVSFATNATLGTPSTPFILKILEAYMPGDVNDDGEINVGDVSAVINHILRRANTVFVEAAADMNGDGEINVGDVSAIINIILKRD